MVIAYVGSYYHGSMVKREEDSLLFLLFFWGFSFVRSVLLASPMLLYNFTLHASSFAFFGRNHFVVGHAPLISSSFDLTLQTHYVTLYLHSHSRPCRHKTKTIRRI
jgi:hypothetical protein